MQTRITKNEITRIQEERELRTMLIRKMKEGLQDAGFEVGTAYKVTEVKQTLLLLGIPFYLFEMAFNVSYSRSLFLKQSVPLHSLLRRFMVKGKIYDSEHFEQDIELKYRVNKETGMIDCYECVDAVTFWDRAGELS